MSFHSMELDFPSWSLVNIPVMHDMDLRTFWDDAPLCIVLYDRVASNGSEKVHPWTSKDYLAVIQLLFLTA